MTESGEPYFFHGWLVELIHIRLNFRGSIYVNNNNLYIAIN